MTSKIPFIVLTVAVGAITGVGTYVGMAYLSEDRKQKYKQERGR